MNKLITSRDIYKQLKADLFGKDSYRGITLTYAWLANQFGHIALGFMPTIILFTILSKYYVNDYAVFWSCIIISVAWLVFETFNFLGPLLSNNRSKSKVIFMPGRQYIFQPAWRNVAFDTITDIGFFWFGVFFASTLCSYSFIYLIILLIIAGLLVYPSCYWFLTKMYLQIPQFPFQFRLSQWDVEQIRKDDIKTINRFLNNKQEGMHLFIFGSENCGKTCLSVGIATELAIQHRPCVYTTAVKLYSMFFDPDEKPSCLWNWRTTSLLVIDDINTGSPVKPDIISPQLFLKFIDTYNTQNETNRAAIRNMNTIWVLGDCDTGNENFEKWHELLVNIGINKNNILSLKLS